MHEFRVMLGELTQYDVGKLVVVRRSTVESGEPAFQLQGTLREVRHYFEGTKRYTQVAIGFWPDGTARTAHEFTEESDDEIVVLGDVPYLLQERHAA